MSIHFTFLPSPISVYGEVYPNKTYDFSSQPI